MLPWIKKKQSQNQPTINIPLIEEDSEEEEVITTIKTRKPKKK